MVRTICLTVLVTLGLWITGAAEARDRGFNNYDGDTFRATFRIANIDTPEIDGAVLDRTGPGSKGEGLHGAVPRSRRCCDSSDGG